MTDRPNPALPWPTCERRNRYLPFRKEEGHATQFENQRVQGTPERRHRAVPERVPAGKAAHPAAGPEGKGDDPGPRQQRGVGVHHRGAGGRCGL